MAAKFATATFLTKLCSEKFTIQRKELYIAKNSAWPGMIIVGSEFFYIGKDKSQFSIPPNIFRRI